MKPSVLVWDLETVPDLAGFAAANELVGKPEADIREVLGNKFPKHIYHTIVCIGALVACRESDRWAVDALGAPHVGERSEKQLIAAFCDKIAGLAPQLVTFNGDFLDLPFLRYRAMERQRFNQPNPVFRMTCIKPPPRRAGRQSTRGLPIYWTSQRTRALRRFMSCSCV